MNTDGEVILPLGFDTSDAMEDAQRLGDEVDKILKADAGTSNSKIMKLDTDMKNAVIDGDKLISKMQELEDMDIPTEQYAEASKELDSLEKEFDRLVEKQADLSGSYEAWNTLQAKIEENRAAVQRVIEVSERLKKESPQNTAKIAEETAKKLHELNDEYTALTKEQKEFSADMRRWDNLSEKVEATADKIKDVKDRMQEMEDTQRAFKDPHLTPEYAELETKLGQCNDKVKVLLTHHKEVTSEVKKQPPALRQVKQSVTDVARATKETSNRFNTFGATIKKIAVYALGIRTLYDVFNRIRSAMKEGVSNLIQWNSGLNTTNAAVSRLQSSILYLKNALGSLAAPIIQLVTPALEAMIDRMSKLANTVARVVGALTGKKTVTIAKKTSVNAAGDKSGGSGSKSADAYAKAQEKYEKAQAKAEEKYQKELQSVEQKRARAAAKAEEKQAKAAQKLAKAQEEVNEALGTYDKLNVINTENTNDMIDDMEDLTDLYEDPVLEQVNPDDFFNGLEDAAAGAGDAFADMFEEVPVDDMTQFIDNLRNKLEPIANYAKELADIFKQGYFGALGDYQSKLDAIQNSAKSIYDSLKEIATDPEIRDSADRFIKSWVGMLGSAAGLISNAVLTVVQAFLGGLEKFLTENKERIKEKLVSLFDIGEEINQELTTLFTDLSDIIEVFGGENAQGIISNVTGIIFEMTAGATELAGKLARDLLDIITKPIHDNKDKIKETIDGILETLNNFTADVKQIVQDIWDKVQEVYDEHFKPLFDDIAQGISDLTSDFLDMWNENIKPALDEVEKEFKKLWDETLKPKVDAMLEKAGEAADWLDEFWNETLKPFVDWVIKNVGPMMANHIEPAFKNLGNVINDTVDIIKSVWDLIVDMSGVVVKIFEGDWKGAWEQAQKTNDNFNQNMSQLGADIVKTMDDWTSESYKKTNDWRELMEKGAKDVGADTIAGYLEGLNENNDANEKEIEGTWSGIIDDAKKILGINSPSTVFKEIGKYTILGLVEGIKDNWDNISKFFENKFDDLHHKLLSTAEKFARVGKSIVTSIKMAFTPEWSGLQSMMNDKFNNLKENLLRRAEAFKNIGQNIVRGIREGIQDRWDDLSSWVRDKFDGLRESARSVLQINSPSKVFAKIGGSITEGLAVGIEDGYSQAESAVEDVAENLVDVMNDTSDEFLFSPVDNAVIDSLGDMLDKLEKISNVFTSISNVLDGISGKQLTVPDIAVGKVIPTSMAMSNAGGGNEAGNGDIKRLLRELLETMEDNSTNLPPVELTLDKKVVARAVFDEQEKRYKQLGQYVPSFV